MESNLQKYSLEDIEQLMAEGKDVQVLPDGTVLVSDEEKPELDTVAAKGVYIPSSY